MLKKFYFILVLFIGSAGFAQNSDSDYTICDCCTYSMFQFRDDYNTVFPPAIMKANNVKELTIYTTSKQTKNTELTPYKIVDNEYKEMIFKFNKDGYVETQTLFNRRGKYHSVYDFERDNNNKIRSKTFYYLDSIGNKMEDYIIDKWIYQYSGTNPSKIKKLGIKLVEEPDSTSDYTIYTYDDKGRVITETRQLYFDGAESAYYKTITKYNDSSNTSIARTNDKQKLFSIVKATYTGDHKKLNEIFIDGRNNKKLEEQTFSYNSNGQLIKFKVQNLGMATECPDGGNLEDNYSYSATGLINSLKHQYKKTICELRFVYK